MMKEFERREGFQMRCADLNAWLDRLMDGELTDGQRRELEAHGRECPVCGEQIRATLEMKALFEEMPAEVDVPLAAQAKWRGAVRAEARGRASRRLYRRIGAAAAAVVLVAGIGWAMNARDIPLRSEKAAVSDAAEAPVEAAGALSEAADVEAMDAAPMMNDAVYKDVAYESEEALDYAASDAAVIEADGYAGSAAESASAPSAPMREIRLTVEDVDAASGVICDLVAEYDGTADAQRAEGGANLYVALPAENAADFLSAIAHLDVTGALSGLSGDFGEGTASLLLALEAKE